MRPILTIAILIGSLCASALPAAAGGAYAFLTLYSSERPVVSVESTPSDLSARREKDPAAGLSPDHPRALDGRIADWRRRLPWWREKDLDRGPLAPYDRESTFERSLESGRAYWENRKEKGAAQIDRHYGSGDSRVLRPVVAAVLWRDGPETALPRIGPRDTYKGVILVGSTYPDAGNLEFFRTAKAALDLTGKLPADLRALTREISRIVYDPPSPQRKAGGVLIDMDAVYAIADIGEKAPLILYRDIRDNSAAQIALDLVGGGVLAVRHRRLIALLDLEMRVKEGTASLSEEELRAVQREIADRRAPVGATAEGRVNAAECELQAVLYEADKALGRSQRAISARLRAMYGRGC